MELIKITEQNGKQAVSARELYEFLGYDKSQWSRWYQKNIIDNEFAIEDIDYQVFDIVSNPETGGRPTKDFALSLEFAKKISMMARTEKGERARNYFLECEKKAKSPYQVPQNFSEALKLAYEQSIKIEEQQKVIEKQAPKVAIANALSVSEGDMHIGSLAHLLTSNGFPIGQNHLFELFRIKGMIQKNNTRPTQKAVEYKFLRIALRPTLIKGEWEQKQTTHSTGKGTEYVLRCFLDGKWTKEDIRNAEESYRNNLRKRKEQRTNRSQLS